MLLASRSTLRITVFSLIGTGCWISRYATCIEAYTPCPERLFRLMQVPHRRRSSVCIPSISLGGDKTTLSVAVLLLRLQISDLMIAVH